MVDSVIRKQVLPPGIHLCSCTCYVHVCVYLDLDKYNPDVCLHILALKTMLLFSDSTCSMAYIFNTLNLLIFLFLTDRKGHGQKEKIYPKNCSSTNTSYTKPMTIFLDNHVILL